MDRSNLVLVTDWQDRENGKDPRSLQQLMARYSTSTTYARVANHNLHIHADPVKVQASRLVSSYAVPPTCSFTCPPCSVRMRRSSISGSVTTRYTVCAVQRPDCQLVCFKETLDLSEIPIISTYNYVIEDQSPAIHVDFVPASTNRSETDSLPNIIVVHQDGTVRKISGDLQTTEWVATSVPRSNEKALPPEVVFARWVSYEDASSALLRRRDDILKESAASEVSFLLLLYQDGDHQESGLRIGVFDVPKTLRNLDFLTLSQRLRLVVSNPVPDSTRWSPAANLQFDFHAASARLFISSRNELTTYDLSGYAPEVSSRLLLDAIHSSIFPLTGSLAAGALRSAVQVYDTNYQSITARFDLGTKSRRSATEDSTRLPVRFVAYLAKINTLVASRGRVLLSFDLPNRGVMERELAGGESFLIDSLGRSTYGSTKISHQFHAVFRPSFTRTLYIPNELEKTQWEARQRDLDKFVLQHQVEEFEHLMANELQEAVADELGRAHRLPLKLPRADQFVRADKVYYLLSKIFRTSAHLAVVGEENEGQELAFAFVAPRLLPWLARHNHLRTSEIERALSNEHSKVQLRLGAVAKAMIEQDPSLALLADYLHCANLAGLDEAASVIRLLIKKAVTMAQKGSPSAQLLLEDALKVAVDESIVYGREVPTSESQGSIEAGGWPKECVTAMKRALDMFNGFSPLKVTSAIRAHLDSEEIQALIQFLRQQLFRSGYTSSFPSPSVASEDAVISLEITILVLSSCIDALGPSGLLGSTLDQGPWQDLVPDLKSEISLALAGIEEAAYLKGVLQEMVRYANAVVDPHIQPIAFVLQGSQPPDKEVGKTLSVYADPAEPRGHDTQARSSLLPLSLDVENGVSRTKKRKGGWEMVERSERELQYLKSRNIGRYSFERLIL
jgi:hypothetical protein